MKIDTKYSMKITSNICTERDVFALLDTNSQFLVIFLTKIDAIPFKRQV